MRWLIVLLLAFLLFNVLESWLHKIGLGRLPGDFHFRLGGRQWHVPLGSAVVLTVLGSLIGLLI